MPEVVHDLELVHRLKRLQGSARGANRPLLFELRNGEWALIACAKDDEPVSVRPFDAITFSLGNLWP